jgi:hypothetical protein
MTVRLITDWICYVTASTLFYIIEEIVEPNITFEGTIKAMLWLFAIPLFIMKLLLLFLPSFTNYRKTSKNKSRKSCLSGRHNRQGRHSDRHHVWWRRSQYRKSTKNKEAFSRKNKERDIHRQIDLLQYFEPVIKPAYMYVIDDDVFYDTYDTYNEPDWLSHPYWLSHDTSQLLAITTKTINAFVDSFDVLSHYNQIKSFESVLFFNSHYYRLDPFSNQYATILIQSRHLKAQVFHYDTTSGNIDETTTEIYVSSCDDELPIVIDTGASNSITPIASDFVDGIINKADLQSLKQVNGTTPVCGQGEVNWDIEDVEGTRQRINTDAYYVPDAGIRLFSPRVYTNANKNSSMQIDSDGILFTLQCGTFLSFPFNQSNNLPFMLTESSLRSRKSTHITSSISTLSRKSIFTSLIDRSVFNRDNFNLNPSQQELLKWHCRWCHCDPNRVRMILSKPHQPKGSVSRGELDRQIVIPSENGASSCDSFFCTACQYAKQKRKIPDSLSKTSVTTLEGVLSKGSLNP